MLQAKESLYLGLRPLTTGTGQMLLSLQPLLSLLLVGVGSPVTTLMGATQHAQVNAQSLTRLF